MAIALLAILFACVNLLYPIKFLGVATRKRAAVILAGSLVAFVIIASLVETPPPPDDVTPSLESASDIPDGAIESPQESDEGVASAAAPDRRVLASWEIEVMQGQKTTEALV